jgi:DNA polymerase III delta subunit
MLHVFLGSDVSKVRGEALKKANSLLAPGATITSITPENGSEAMLKDALGATSLFHSHEVCVLDTLSLDEELFLVLGTMAPLLHESQNQFVVIEGTLTAKQKKVFEAAGVALVEYQRPEAKEFNVFGLSDALSARDKKTLWILLQEAWRDGRATEELVGTLFWQIKMLRLAEVTRTADEAGQKPFVYNKAKSALRNFKEGELTKFSGELTLLYHEGHIGKRDIKNALEAWVLRL